MSVYVETFILGPIENNTYLLIDEATHVAAVIDPATPSQNLVEKIHQKNAILTYILLTHAHFDHIGGVRYLARQSAHKLRIALHTADFDLWRNGGGSKDFGFDFDPGEEPDWILQGDDSIDMGKTEIQVLHTPGHTHGHVTFFLPQEKIAFCGDLIFHRGIGRTDLNVSHEPDLFKSIQEKIFSLPDETVLYPGHGPATSVADEKLHNPYL